MKVSETFSFLPGFFNDFVEKSGKFFKFNTISGYQINNSKSIEYSEDIKFWVKTGFSVFILAASSYTVYRLLKELEGLGKTSKETKQKGQELLKKLGIKPSINLTDHEWNFVTNIIDPSSLSTEWESIGGYESIIEEIQKTVLIPVVNTNVVSSKLYKLPKGLLIYGPPGCGKTMLVKALAKSSGANFINIQVSSLMNMYFGESEKNIDALFTLAAKIQPTIIFIDEIDGLLSSRKTMYGVECYMTMKTMFLSLWDGIMSDDSRILIAGATNRPNAIDEAILRRLQIKIEVKLPTAIQRKSIFTVILKNESLAANVTENTFDNLASLSEGLSGSDIKDVCQDAVVSAVHRLRNCKDQNKKFEIEDRDFYASLERFVEKMHRFKSL